MRKIISSTFISLDGVIERPQNWTTEYFQDEATAYARKLLFSCGAILMGRRTFDGFSQSWPAMAETTGDFGVRMNTLPHYVVSDSLRKPGWGDTTAIPRARAVTEITALKERDGQDILQYGFGPVTRTLIDNGLLDELRLWIHPVVVGTGDPDHLLTRADFSGSFELVGTTSFTTGVIIATYRPVRSGRPVRPSRLGRPVAR